MSFLSKVASNNSARQVLFGVSGASALVTSGILFRDLADISQWVVHCDRNDVFRTFRNRHKLAKACAASMALNAYAAFGPGLAGSRPVPRPAWLAVNGLSAVLLYSGYANPEIMMRPRNADAVYVPSGEALSNIKRSDTVIVTHAAGVDGDNRGRYLAFPDAQVLRPHVVRIGKTPSGSQVLMTYCGLTNLGMVYEIQPRFDGTDVELVPMTQLENNLVLLDKKTGHTGQQINGVDENVYLERIFKCECDPKDFSDTKRRPTVAELKELRLDGSEIGKELPTWRMSAGSFVRTYPDGKVFLNDYKMFKDLKKPVKTIYDTLMDWIFEFSVYFQATDPRPVFPTIKNIDPRLPPKELVWAFSVGDDYVAVDEEFVRSGKNGTRNIKVGNEDIVASYDVDVGSIGIWRNPTGKPITQNVDVHGIVGGSGGKTKLERVNNVKAGAFWFVVANFFPMIRVNPEK